MMKEHVTDNPFRISTILTHNNFSLGGFTALVAAVGLREQVVGVALLNSAGQFGNPNAETNKSEESILQKLVLKPLKEIFQRVVLGFLFWQAKQPARIESVLKSVSHLILNLTRAPFKHELFI